MTTKNPGRPGAEDDFSFGVRELQTAQRAYAQRQAVRREATNAAAAARKRVEMALIDSQELRKLRVVEENTGFDPYNSGSFDRRNAWSKVGKR